MKSIWVAGDFFHDEYNIGSYRGKGPRFNVEKTIIRPGGAGNTALNVAAICSNTPDIRCHRAGSSQPKVLRRWVENGSTVFESWVIHDGVTNPWHKWGGDATWNALAKKDPEDFRTLIVSDYDKGFNDEPVRLELPCDLLVVDSRYRTAPAFHLGMAARTRIWRCTGKEYDEEYAKDFDFVVHTSHEGHIKIIEVDQPGPPVVVLVPPAIVIDPCGAGDTFTAAFSAWLTNSGNVCWDNIVLAAQFAVTAAQDVCKKPYTAVTDVKLETECTSQT